MFRTGGAWLPIASVATVIIGHGAPGVLGCIWSIRWADGLGFRPDWVAGRTVSKWIELKIGRFG